MRNLNADGFGCVYPRCAGGHPPKFTLASGGRLRIAKSKPALDPVSGK